MTHLLEKALAAAAKLPEAEQNALAVAILAEVHGESEAAWDERFAQSSEALARLADEALEEERRGTTRELDPDEL